MTKRVIVELRMPFGFSMESIQVSDVATMSGLEMDLENKPVPVKSTCRDCKGPRGCK